MANTNWDQHTQHGPGEREGPLECQAGDLKNLLHTIAEQLADADRRHTDALQQMQDRIAGMGQEARFLKARVPDQFASAFDRVEAGMAELASRIAESAEFKSGPVAAATSFTGPAPATTQDAWTPPSETAPWSIASPPSPSEAPMALRSAEPNVSAARWQEEATSRRNAGIDTFDVIESSVPANASDPWDRDSAEALTGLYEGGGANFSGSMPAAGQQTPGPNNYASATFAAALSAPAAAADTAWLESRFAELTQRLDQSLAEIRPDQGFFDLSQRIDQAERHISDLLDSVATRADVEGLRLIEAHVGELVGHLEGAHRQLERLDTIESHIADIADKLADVNRAAEGVALSQPVQQDIDLHSIAQQAADAAARRMADQLPRHQPQDGNDVRGLIERLMTESRQGEENTTALLDTLQQAMIRLLDRVDAMEMTQVQNFQSQGAPQEYVREQVRFNVDPHRPQGYGEDEPSAALDAAVAAVASAKSMYQPFSQSPAGDTMPDNNASMSPGATATGNAGQAPRSTEKLRQDFIAEARRAKMLLSTEGEPSAIVIAKPDDATPSPSTKPQKPAAKAAVSPTKGKQAATSLPRLMVMSLGALTVVGGLWYTLNGSWSGQDATNAATPAASSASPSKTSNLDNAAEAQAKKEARSDAASETQNGAGVPAASEGAAGQEAQPELNIHEGTQGAIVPGDMTVGSTSVPVLGVAVDSAKQATAADIQRARRQNAMAIASGKLGEVSASTSNPAMVFSATRAALMPESPENGAADSSQGHTAIAKNGMSHSSPLDLPPATVGPLSLRLAAANGDPSAQFQVGARLAEGKGNEQSFVDAAKWYQRAASSGFAQAQYRLGTLYERGLGIKADPAKAEGWYLQAAELGNIKAMHNLAVMSANQKRNSPDYTSAAKWFAEAAERGLPDSQFNLAVLHENGLGVPPDMKQAYKWLAISARSGDAEAIRRRDILKGKLTAEDLAVAEDLIKRWKVKSSDPMVNDARTASDAWKKNPANGVSG